MSDEPDRGVKLRCTKCGGEQVCYLGPMHDRMQADDFLHMITGGRSGNPPPGMPRLDAWQSGTSLIGRSACCDAQIAGELFGYEETTS